MNLEPEIIDVSPDNLSDHPQVICFINPKHELYHNKVDWLKEQFKNGPLPSINDWQKELVKYKGLSMRIVIYRPPAS